MVNEMGEFYAEYDEESASWCVFHTGGEHAYSSWSGQEEAEEDARRLNEPMATYAMFG